MQTLIACPPFHSLFRALSKGKFSKEQFPTLFRLTRFINEFDPIDSSHKLELKRGKEVYISVGPSFAPQYLYELLKEFNPISDEWQEDMQEFLLFLIDRVHTELLEIGIDDLSEETSVICADGNSSIPGEWVRVDKQNKSSIVVTDRTKFKKSVISAIFGGELQSTIRRKTAKPSTALEPFFCLHLDINSENITSLEEAMDEYVETEKLSDSDNGSIQMTKQNSISALPSIFLIHLKRFAYEEGNIVKICKDIEYPEKLVIKSKWMSSSFISGRTYRLFAVIRHLGQKAQGGHYTCYVKQFNDVWLHFDDADVQAIEIEKVLAEPNAYVLAYIKEEAD